MWSKSLILQLRENLGLLWLNFYEDCYEWHHHRHRHTPHVGVEFYTIPPPLWIFNRKAFSSQPFTRHFPGTVFTNQQIFSTHKSLHPQLLQRPDITSEREIIQYNIIDWIYLMLSNIESIPYYGTHNIIDSASQIGQPLLMRVLNLPVTAQEGWGQKVLAQPLGYRSGGTGSKSACSTSSFTVTPHSR